MAGCGLILINVSRVKDKKVLIKIGRINLLVCCDRKKYGKCYKFSSCSTYGGSQIH